MQEPGTKPRPVLQKARTCPVCGTKFFATTDREFCPVCILRGATGGESAATAESGSVSELAASSRSVEGYAQEKVSAKRVGNFRVEC